MRVSLEELEAERGNDLEPFELDLGEQVITLPHPRDLPFGALLDLEGAGASDALRVLMGDASFDALTSAERPDGSKRVTLGLLEQVMTRYSAHYGLGSPGEGGASQPSSIGSARRSKRTSGGRTRASA